MLYSNKNWYSYSHYYVYSCVSNFCCSLSTSPTDSQIHSVSHQNHTKLDLNLMTSFEQKPQPFYLLYSGSMCTVVKDVQGENILTAREITTASIFPLKLKKKINVNFIIKIPSWGNFVIKNNSLYMPFICHFFCVQKSYIDKQVNSELINQV